MPGRIKLSIALLLSVVFINAGGSWAQDPTGRPKKPPEKTGKTKTDRPKTPRTSANTTPPTVLLTVLTTPPECDIYINGDKRGASSAEGRAVFDKMPLAQYTVEARKEGFRNASKVFVAGSDQPTLIFNLEPDLDAPTKQFDLLIASGTLMGDAQPNALALLNELSAKYPDRPEIARMRSVLAAKLSDRVKPVITNTVTGWRKVSRDDLAHAAEFSAKAAELRGDDARTKSEAAYFHALLALRDWQMGNSADGSTSAKAELEKITTADATFAAAFYQLGYVLLALNDLRGAEAPLLNAVKLEPHWAAAYTGLGWVYYNTDRSREAIDAYRKASTEDPTSAAAFAGLGLARSSKGEKDGVKDIERAKQLDPSSGVPHLYHGIYLSQSKKSKDLESAERELTTAIQKNSNNLEFQNSKAQQTIDDVRKRRKK